MKRSGRKQEWSLTMFVFGVLFFFPPLVSIFDKPYVVLGVPLAYLVMFGMWGLIIFGIWRGARPIPLRGDTLVVSDQNPRDTIVEPAQSVGKETERG